MTRAWARVVAGVRTAAMSGLLIASPLAARAQAVDCTALRSEIDAARVAGGPERLDLPMRQQRAEIDRTRDYADDSGCNGNSPFDDPDSQQCRSLARRLQQLEAGLQRLEDQAARGDPGQDARRRGLVEQFNAYCTGAGDEATGSGNPASDPDTEPNASPAPKARFGQVYCVRQCDGAYYPLAVDVPADRLDAMDQVCKAQCPNAASSAYAVTGGDDVSTASAADGSSYASLPTAFRFRSSVTEGCSCRAPHQSWAEALAGADALLESRKGDVTVTPEIAAAMSRPIVPARPGGLAKPATTKPVAGGKTGPAAPAPLVIPPLRGAASQPGPETSGSNPGEDLTRQFRRAAPTL